MDWKRAIREERAVLARIVALLLALADLAELASGRSRAVCGFLLFMFRPAETAVWTFAGCPAGALPAPIAPSGDVCAEMMEVAERFRELARILQCQADLVFSSWPEDDDRPLTSPGANASSLLAAAILTFDVVRPVHAPDTS